MATTSPTANASASCSTSSHAHDESGNAPPPTPKQPLYGSTAAAASTVRSTGLTNSMKHTFLANFAFLTESIHQAHFPPHGIPVSLPPPMQHPGFGIPGFVPPPPQPLPPRVSEAARMSGPPLPMGAFRTLNANELNR